MTAPSEVWIMEEEDDREWTYRITMGIYESAEAAMASIRSASIRSAPWIQGDDGEWRSGYLVITKREVEGMPAPPPPPLSDEEVRAERERLRAEVRTPLPYEGHDGEAAR